MKTRSESLIYLSTQNPITRFLLLKNFRVCLFVGPLQGHPDCIDLAENEWIQIQSCPPGRCCQSSASVQVRRHVHRLRRHTYETVSV